MLYILMGLAVASEIKVIGWSDDERYVAIRTIENVTTESVITGAECGFSEEKLYHPDFPPIPKYPSNFIKRCTERIVFCPEYVSPETNSPFFGDLKITIYEVQEQQINLRTFLKLVPVTPAHVIYRAGTFVSTSLDEGGTPEESPGECTSHARAAKELKMAKSVLKKYQINRQSTGGSVRFEQIDIEKEHNVKTNDVIGYTIGSSVLDASTDSTQPSLPDTLSFQGELTYLISMQKNVIDGLDVMIVGWSKLYEGEASDILEISSDLNLLNAAPFQSVYTAPWAGSSKYKLHSVLLSPTGNLVLFAQENTVSGYWGNYHTEDLTFPIVIKTDDLTSRPR
jgi:hypothetical protein